MRMPTADRLKNQRFFDFLYRPIQFLIRSSKLKGKGDNMGFFKNFKDDLSQAVNELVPEEKVEESMQEISQEVEAEEIVVPVEPEAMDSTREYEDLNKDLLDAILDNHTDNSKQIQEERKEEEPKLNQEPKLQGGNGSSEVTIIAKGTSVNGNINSDGSLEVMGSINGDVECDGKLTVLGRINGNCAAAEVYVASERLLGSVISESCITIGKGAILIGDITATSGFIAGAIKGNIDINGSIVVDSSAIIKGNIKAKSIQINQGAIIEGFCSLSYASVDIDNVFA